jgi:hypothetical protein
MKLESENMQVDLMENALLSAAVNPWLKVLISRFDMECQEDGNLLLNSLKDFLGEPVSLCPTCQQKSRLIAKPIYEVGSRLLKVDKGFMKKQFLQDQYGGAWFRGFGLMMKGVRKYGIRIMWVSLDCLEVSAISMFDFAS